jgi:hypothetical protein
MLVFSIAAASGQNLIGFSHDEIREYMKENHKDMNFNNVTNTQFSYLKYSDNSENQTILFFLDPDSVCKSVRIICDINSKKLRIREFDSIYKKKDANQWIDTRKGLNYLIELKDEEWSSVITMLPVK